MISDPSAPTDTIPLIVDVDTGIDDSLALLYLMASPEADILAITCTAGNVPARQVATNNLAWLDLCAYRDVEVAIGAEVPIVQPLMTTEETHGPQGIGYAELPAPNRPLSTRHATAVWCSLARSRPGEITGLVTGPLTNLALAIKLDPELPRLLKRLVVMGGAFNHAGNTRPTTEWNIAVDPDAAKIVFDAFSGLPADRRPIICALDVTERIEMTPEHVAELARVAGTRRGHQPRGSGGHPILRIESRGSAPFGRGALLHGVPCVPRPGIPGTHARSVRGGRRAGRESGRVHGGYRGCRDRWDIDSRPNGRRLARDVGSAAERGCRHQYRPGRILSSADRSRRALCPRRWLTAPAVPFSFALDP